jgi:23S rRNA A2030 N6-methylase RlmJ
VQLWQDRRVANHHFANIGDVWKHLWLATVLSEQRPAQYVETHAGSALYRLVDDAERRIGVRTFMAAAASCQALRSAAYYGALARFVAADEPSYPGSPLLAMTTLGAASRYVFCETDQASVDDLRAAADRLGLSGAVQVIAGDGVSKVLDMVETRQLDESGLVHVDPFDFDSTVSSSVPARELIKHLAAARVPAFAWYHLAAPTASLELFHEIAAAVREVRVSCCELRLGGPQAALAGTASGCGVLLVGDGLAAATSLYQGAANTYLAVLNEQLSDEGYGITAVSELVTTA